MKLESPLPYHWLESHFESQPNAILMYYEDGAGDDQSITYKNFYLAVQSFAAQLVNYPPKTIVSVCSDNPLDYLICMMAAFKLQMIYLPFLNNFSKITTECIIEHLELAKNHYKSPGFICTSNNNFLPSSLFKFQMLINTNDNLNKPVANEKFNLNNPAYICSSSGTSEKPKLILSDYTGLHLRVKEHAEQVLNGSGQQVLLGFSGFDFDASVMDFLMVLYKGKALALVPDHVKRNIFNALPHFFQKHAKAGHPITSGVLLPSILCGVKNKGLNPDHFPGLRTLVVMGDTCKMEWLYPWLENGVTIYHGYGHTETAIASIIAKIDRNTTYLPLGTPLEGAIIYLLDTEKNVVVATLDKNTSPQQLLDYSKQLGTKCFELVQGGIGVGQYLHKDEHNSFLTKTDQNWPYQNSERVYRSGDLVSLEHGQLIFQERVKIFKRNGMRYNLSDIEAKFKKIVNVEHLAVKEIQKFIAVIVKFHNNIEITERNKIIDALYQEQAKAEILLKPDFFLEVNNVAHSERFKFRIDTNNLKQFTLLHNSTLDPCKTETEKQLANQFATLLLPDIAGINTTIQRNSVFKDLGADSIKISMLTSLIWQEIMKKDPKEGIPFDFSNYIYQYNKLSDIADFIETYQYNARKVINNIESCVPAFYLANMSPPHKQLLTDQLKVKIFQLIPKQFAEHKETTSEGQNWESMLEQCLRAIYKFQETGPYLLLTNKSDLDFARQIAIQLAQMRTRIQLICFNDNQTSDPNVLASLRKWLSEKRATSVYGEINIIEKKLDDIKEINDAHENITKKFLDYKLMKYYKQVEQQFSDNENLTTPKINITGFIEDFCRSENNSLFISGPPGTFKTVNCLNVFNSLKKAYVDNRSDVIPLILTVKQNTEFNVLNLLKQYGFNDKDLTLLESKKTLLFVLDYSLQKRSDYPNYHLQLKKWLSLKIIISTQHYLTDSQLAVDWKNTPYLRIELERPKLESLAPSTEDVYQKHLVSWLHQQLKAQPTENGFNIEHFFDYIIKLPKAIILNPQPSLWERNCSEVSRAIKKTTNHPYFRLIRGLLSQNDCGSDVFHCPDWLKTLAIKNRKERSTVASFTTFEIEMQNHDSTLTKLLEPEELQHIIASKPFFVPLNTGQQQAPIFFFHPLTGATPNEYRILARSLGPSQAAYNFVMSDNETSSINFNERCLFFAKIIKKIQPQGPVNLIGWSYGGLTAVGVASILEKSGTVGLLLNIDCSSPLGLHEIPAGDRAIDLISALPGLYNFKSELNMKKECQDLQEECADKNLTTEKLHSLIDKIFDCATKFYQTQSSLDNIKKSQFLIGLKNCSLNIKAAYDCMANPPKLHKTKLHIIECGYTKGINLPQVLAGSLWHNVINDEEQIKKESFHTENHFTIFRNQRFINYFQKLVAEQQALVQPITLKQRIKQYQKSFTSVPLYIQQEGKESELHSKRYHLLQTKLPEIFKRNVKFLLISGDSGSGKTTLLRHVMAEHTHFRDLNKSICIFVKINDDPIKNIFKTLKENSFTEIEINNALKRTNIIFLLDGLEKINSSSKLNELTQQWPNARFIVTCRKDNFKLLKSLFSSHPQWLIECELCTFSDDNINHYITKYEEQHRTRIDFIGKFSEHPDTKKLITNPLILTLLLEILRQTGSFELFNLNRTKIFRTYHYLNIYRALQSQKINRGIPPGTNFFDACINFAESLAIDIFVPNKNSIDRFKKYIEEDIDTQLVREAIPISRHEGNVDFSHDSHGEYFIAYRLFKDLDSDHLDLWGNFLFSRMTTTVKFIAEMLNGCSDTKRTTLVEKLFTLILASRPPALDRAVVTAANAITVLNYARVSFTNRDFSYVQIDNADMSNSCNHGTNYYKASLVNVDLRNAWFRACNCEGVRWGTNNFGFLPDFPYSGKIKGMHISPQRKYILFTDAENGWITVFNLNTFQLVKCISDTKAAISSISFSPDEKTLIFADEMNCYHVFQFDSNKSWSSQVKTKPIVGFAPHGKNFVIATSDCLTVHDSQTKEITFSFKQPTDNFWYLPTGDSLLILSLTNELKLIDLQENENTLLEPLTSEINAIAHKDNATFFASLHLNNQIMLVLIVPQNIRDDSKIFGLRLTMNLLGNLLMLPKTEQEHIYRQDQMNNSLTELSSYFSEDMSSIPEDEQSTERYNIRKYIFSDNSVTKIIQLLFNPSAEILASLHDNNQIAIWAISTKKIIKKLSLDHEITTLAFDECGNILAAGTKQGYIYLWNTENWELINKIYSHTSQITKIEFSEQTLISLDDSKMYRLWMVSELKSSYSIGHNTTVTTVKRTKNSDAILSLSSNGKVCKWRLSSGQLTSCYQLPAAKLYEVSEHASYVAMYNSGSILLFNTVTLKRITLLEELKAEVQFLRFDPSEQFLYISLIDKEKPVLQVNLATLKYQILHLKSISPIIELQFIKNNNLIFRCLLGNIYLCNSITGNNLTLINRTDVTTIATKIEGNYIAFTRKYHLFIFDLTLNKIVFQQQFTLAIRKIYISNDGLTVTVHTKERISVWNILDKTCVYHCQLNNMVDFCWSDDDKDLAIIDSNKINSWHRDGLMPYKTSQHRYINYKKICHYRGYFLLLGSEGEIEAWQFRNEEGCAEWRLRWRTHSSPFNAAASTILNSVDLEPGVAAFLVKTGADKFTSYTNINNLFSAVKINKFSRVKMLCQKGADVNQIDENNFTPLQYATFSDYLEMTNYLLNRGANIKDSSNVGSSFNTALYKNREFIIQLFLKQQPGTIISLLNSKPYPLIAAILGDHPIMVELVLYLGANPYEAGNSGTGLHLAVRLGNPDIVKILLRYQKELDRTLDAEKIEGAHLRASLVKSNLNGATALHLAVHYQHLEIVELLIDAGANVNARTKTNWTPLHFAAHNGDREIAETLLLNGAKTNILSDTKKTSLLIAIEKKNEDVASILLIAIDQDLAEADRCTLLLASILNKLNKTTLALLTKRTNVNFQTSFGSPLHLAVELGELEAVKMLLEFGANPNCESGPSKCTPVQLAVIRGDNLILSELLAHKGDFKQKHNGFTTLKLAARFGYSKIVEMLIKNGLDPNDQSQDGVPALPYAVLSNDLRSVQLLAPHTNNINQYYNGFTLLHVAAMRCQIEMVTILLTNGADPTLPCTRFDNLPLMIVLMFSRNEDTVIHILQFCSHHNPVFFSKLLALDTEDNNTLVLSSLFKCALLALPLSIKCNKVVQFLINHLPKFDLHDLQQYLALAVGSDNSEAITILVEAGATVDFDVNNGNTLLAIAANENKYDVVSTLIQCGANIDARGADNYTSLHRAFRKGDAKMFQLLIDLGADVNAEMDGSTMIHLAIMAGNLTFFKILFAANANPNALDQEFHYLLANDQTDIIDQFQNSIKECKLANVFGITVSELNNLIAILKNRAQTILGKEVFDDCTPLHLAACLGDLDTTIILQEAGAQIVPSKKSRVLPLQFALRFEHFNVAQLYIESINQKLANAVDSQGRSPMHDAAKSGRLDFIEKLLAKGADINARDSAGDSPLKWACEKSDKNDQNIPMIRLLLGLGANPKFRNNAGESILHLCVRYKNLSALRLFIELGVDPNAQTNKGNTALNDALHANLSDFVNALLPKVSEKPNTANAPQTNFFAQENQINQPTPNVTPPAQGSWCIIV